MMSELIDAAAREAAVKQLHSFNLTAGPGAGKTKTLVDRILHVLASDNAEISQVVAITFTVKAAWELKTRLRNRLIDTDERWAKRALEGLEDARISTIDRLVGGLLGEYPIAAGFITGAKVISIPEYEKRFSDWFETALGQWEKDESLQECWGLLFEQGLTLWAIENHLRSLTKFAAEHPGAILPQAKPEDIEEELRSGLDALDWSLVPETEKYRTTADALDRQLRGLLNGKALEVTFKIGREGGARVKPFKDAMKALFPVAEALVAARSYAALRPLLDTAVADGNSFCQQLEGEGLLSFDRALKLVTDFLERDAEARDDVQGGIRHLLVDEFQDTSPDQIRFCRLLAGKAAMFTVGDERQSIYAFRGAAVENYHDFLSGSEVPVASLQVNFRSVAEVVTFVSEKFDPLFQKDGRAALKPFRSSQGSTHVGFLNPPAGSEGDEVAAAIATVLEGNEALRYRDIAVLVRQKSRLKVLAPALERRSIPFVASIDGLISEAEAFRAVNNVVQFAVLGPEMVKERAIARWGALHSWAYDVDLKVATSPTVKAAEEAIENLCRTIETMRPYDAVETVIRDCHLEEKGFCSAERMKEIGALRAVRDLALGAEEAGIYDLSGFAVYLPAAVEEANAIPVLDDTTDAVKIMTIHRSKGLEFPVVIVVGIGGPLRSPGSVLLDGERRIQLSMLGAKSPGYAELAKQVAAKAEAEHARLSYVGCTRAEDHLMVSAYNGDKGPLKEWFAEHVQASELELDYQAARPPVSAVPIAITKPPVMQEQNEKRVTPTSMAAKFAELQDDFDPATEDPEEGFVPGPLSLGGLAVGRAAHLALQAMAWDGSNFEEAVAAASTRAAVDGAVVRPLVAHAMATDLWKEAAASPHALREVYVAGVANDALIALGAQADELVEGVIDLAFSDASGGMVLVDYKTDQVSHEVDARAKVEERYQVQGRAYAELLRVSTGRKVTRAAFVFLRASPAIVVELKVS